MKKLLLSVACIGILHGAMPVYAEEDSKAQESAIQFAAAGYVACDLLSLPAVAYPVFKFTVNQLLPLTGSHYFLDGAACGAAVVLGVMVAEGIVSLYPVLYKKFGFSDEFVNKMCLVHEKGIKDVMSWAILGGLIYSLYGLSRN